MSKRNQKTATVPAIDPALFAQFQAFMAMQGATAPAVTAKGAKAVKRGKWQNNVKVPAHVDADVQAFREAQEKARLSVAAWVRNEYGLDDDDDVAVSLKYGNVGFMIPE